MGQLEFKLPQKGGRRKGAGRKPKGPRALVSHKVRTRFETPAAVLVTLRVATHVWNLRSRRCFRVIEEALASARERFGLRVIEFSVLGNHLHLLVEADSDVSLARGMQGLEVRIAKALNRVMERRGRVFADHYHSRLLRSPTELVNAVAYVLGNHTHHFGGPPQRDPFSSGAYDLPRRERVLSHPVSWLATDGGVPGASRRGWRSFRLPPDQPLATERRYTTSMDERVRVADDRFFTTMQTWDRDAFIRAANATAGLLLAVGVVPHARAAGLLDERGEWIRRCFDELKKAVPAAEMIRSSWSSLWIYLPHREAAGGGSAVAAVVAGLAEPELESRLEVRGDALAALDKLENEVGH